MESEPPPLPGFTGAPKLKTTTKRGGRDRRCARERESDKEVEREGEREGEREERGELCVADACVYVCVYVCVCILMATSCLGVSTHIEKHTQRYT